jgi:signal-transduction protein with cAMP-binding, CBS, and nucleotidyltransferase domain
MRISEWTETPSPQALLELNVMLDRRHAWGKEELTTVLDGHLSGISKSSPGLIGLYRRNAMLYRPPNPRKNGGIVDIKEGLKPLEIQLRLMAFTHKIPAVSTLDRLNALHSAGVIGELSAADLRLAFETFWNLRFRNQLVGHRRAVRTDDSIDMKSLPELERRNLTACLEIVEAFVKRRALESERY